MSQQQGKDPYRSDAQLKRGVGLSGVVMFGAGTAIGVSIFSVLQPAAQVAGSGLLLAVLIAALPMVLFAVCYAYLGSALPVSGASYEWPRRFIHPFVGFAIGWMRIVGNVGALILLSQVMANYLSMVYPIPAKPLMAVTLTAVFALNYRGVAVAAKVQVALMLLLLLVLAVFVGTGLPVVEAQRIGPLTDMGWLAIFAAVPLMASLFMGIESAVEIGEEIQQPGRNIPLGITLAILLTAGVYLAVAFVALGLAGPARLAASEAPLLEAARVSLGDYAVPLIVGAATISILKTMNATAMVFSRSLFAMARNQALPGALAAVHRHYGTPHRAIGTGYVLAMCGLLLPSSILFLLLAVNIPTMLKYLACSWCAVRVATRHPDLHAQAAFRPAARTMAVVGTAAMIGAVAIILVGLEADWRPYLLVGGWLAIGCVYWLARGHKMLPEALSTGQH